MHGIQLLGPPINQFVICGRNLIFHLCRNIGTIPNLKSVLWSFTRIIQMKYFAEGLKRYNHMITMGFCTL